MTQRFRTTLAATLVALLGALFAQPATGGAAPATPSDHPGHVLLASGPDDQTGIQLFTVADDGSNQTALTHGLGLPTGNLRPVWSPDGTRIAWSGSVFGNADILVSDTDGSNRVVLSRVAAGPFPTGNVHPAWSPDGTRIAWSGSVGGERQVYVADADGTNRVTISNVGPDPDPTFNQYPTWSPDGTRIAWEAIVGGSQTHLVVADADGSNRTVITAGSGLTENRYAAWSPDGTRITWAGTTGAAFDIYVADPDGTNLVNASDVPADADLVFNSTPAWSPDGTRIAWAGTNHIHVADPDGANHLRISDIAADPDPGGNQAPTWSPDGTTIGWVGYTGDLVPRFFVAAPDGTGRAQVPGVSPRGDLSDDARVLWSPDGTRLLWSASSMADQFVIRVGDPDGANQVEVSRVGSPVVPATNTQGRWSPDGARVAWIGFDGTDRQVFVADADGTDPVTISPVGAGPDPTDNRDPAWSPDGTRIAWAGHDGSTQQIYVADANGANRTTISTVGAGTDPTDNGNPTWSPDGTRIAWNGRVDGTPRVVVADADGANRQLVADAGFVPLGAEPMPAWSPDGTRLAWGAADGMHVSDADGSDDDIIGTAPAYAIAPEWSPGGTSIAWAGGDGVHVTAADGSTDLIVSTVGPDPDPTFITGVRWSPDGTKLAWDGSLGGARQLFVSNADGTDRHVVGDRLGDPDWAPAGVTPPPPPPPPAPSVPEGATRFVPLPPLRLFDTRDAGPAGKLGPDQSIDVQITGVADVPAEAVAVVMNVTATEATAPGFVTAHATGTARPNASNLNLTAPGQTRPNLVTVPIGAGGRVRLYTQSGAHLLADVAGYYVPVDAPVRSGRVVPVTPKRIFDSRDTEPTPGPKGLIGAGESVRVQVRGIEPVPDTGVAAVILNITGTGAVADGFVTAHPSDVTRPNSSILNLQTGGTAPNLVMIPLAADGTITLYSQSGAHLLADVTGYVTDTTAATSTAGLFVPLDPDRIFDTRPDQIPQGPKGRLGADGEIAVPTVGQGGLPDSGVAAVVINLTATEADTGFVTAWPSGVGRPLASTLNLTGPLDTRPNAAILPVGADGRLRYFVQSPAHLLADTSGYFTS